MNDTLYREIILDHWENPQNYGVIKDADFDVSDSNPLCGDEIRITGKFENGVLSEIAFVSTGCAISKASASLFTEKIKGMTLEKIRKIKNEEVLDELGIEISPSRAKCALLVYNAITKQKRLI